MRVQTLLLTLLTAGAAALAYRRFLRPGVLNWGATDEEVRASLPGDGIVPNPALQTTRAITIDVPPSDVWPWLVQMGPSPRAGVYTYDWLERMLGIDIQNSDRILPEYQHMEPGEYFALNKDGTNGLFVREVLTQRAIVLQWKREGSSWAFVLNQMPDGRTRLVSRNRIPGNGAGFRLAMAVMEPASLVMERKMLRGIKQRAEAAS